MSLHCHHIIVMATGDRLCRVHCQSTTTCTTGLVVGEDELLQLTVSTIGIVSTCCPADQVPLVLMNLDNFAGEALDFTKDDGAKAISLVIPTATDFYAGNDTGPAPSSPCAKKRAYPRRGGEAHATLFKSVALAAMSSPLNGGEDDSGEDDDGGSNSRERSFGLTRGPDIPEFDTSPDSGPSNRKRLRLSDQDLSSIIARTSGILNSLSVSLEKTGESTSEEPKRGDEVNSDATKGGNVSKPRTFQDPSS
jgi:hypothetical protein